MPTNRETILQTFRTAFKTALSPTLTDENCIPADDVGPRPDLPYITVKVTVADIPVGVDEMIRESNSFGDPTTRNRGHRSGTVTVNGFGADTAGWFEVFTLRLGYDSIIRLFQDDGIAVISRGAGVTDLSILIDTQIEPRFLREFEISYSVVDAAKETLPKAEIAQVGIVLEDRPNDPDPLTSTIVITL